jgi:predicted XRE-type DNA-binding protein
MSLTVDQINDNAFKNGEIKKIIDDLLILIDSKITQERGIGQQKVMIDLPISYPTVGNIVKADIETLIYIELISSLDERGFNVKIEFRDGICDRIHVSWIVCLSEERKQKMLEKLKKHRY